MNIPPLSLTGMHDGAAIIKARKALQIAFELARDFIEPIHLQNVAAFGWRDAEVLRSEAFAEAMAAAERPCGAICAAKVRDGMECSPGRCAVRESAEPGGNGVQTS